MLKDGKPQYRIEMRSRQLDDFLPTCWYQSTSPSSHFTQSTICSRLTDDGRVSISGRTLIKTSGPQRSEERLPDEAALLAAYREYFGIVLRRAPSFPKYEGLPRIEHAIRTNFVPSCRALMWSKVARGGARSPRVFPAVEPCAGRHRCSPIRATRCCPLPVRSSRCLSGSRATWSLPSPPRP